MRKLTAGLVTVFLSAASAAAIAGPNAKTTDPWDQEETFEWMSSSQGARLGVMVMSLTPELRDYFGAASDKGVLVAKVEPSSAAEKAGIKVGDVIVDVKGSAVEDAGDVIHALSDSKTGDKVDIAVVRDHKPVALKATIDKASPLHERAAWRRMFPWFNLDPDAPAHG
jgi:C-terminal processing protease CtpA/Prc